MGPPGRAVRAAGAPPSDGPPNRTEGHACGPSDLLALGAEDLLFDVEAPQFGPPKVTASSIDRFRTVGEMRRAHGLHGHEGVLEVYAGAPR